MHSVELYEQAIEAARTLGFGIRQEYLGGAGGGPCQFGGKKWIFIDLAMTPVEQLEQVLEALRRDPGLHTLQLSPALLARVGGAPSHRRAG